MTSFVSKGIYSLLEITDDLKNSNLKNLNLTRDDLAEAVNTVTEWFRLQPHLPDVVPDSDKIECIFLSCKGSIERTKRCLDTYYTLKNISPEILIDRDPLYTEINDAHEGIIAVITYPVTEDGYRVGCIQCRDPDKYSAKDWLKYVFMTLDLRLKYDCGCGFVFVIDMSGIKMGHILQTTPSLLQLSLNACQNAFTTRIKQVHFINPPSYADTLISIIKSLLSHKIRARIFMHSTFEDLHKMVDKKYLPKDFGGELKSLNEIQSEWYKELIEMRDWFLEEDKYTTDESRRPLGKTQVNDLLGIHGSFRKLDVD